MSNERFDRLMKKNLEALRPNYQPSAWNRFRKRLPLGLWGRLLPYGGWLLSGLMLTGWLTTLYTLHINQQVIKQLTKTLAVRTDSVHLMPALSTLSASTHRVDTVYVVQRTVVEHRYTRSPEDTPLNGNSPLTDQDRPASQKVTHRLNRTEPRVDSPQFTLPSSKRPPLAVTHPLLDKQALSRQVNRPNLTEREPAQPDLAEPTTRTKTRQATPSSTKGFVADSVNRAGTEAPSAGSNPIQKDQPALLQADSMTQQPVSLSVTASVPATQPANQSRPSFRLSSLQPRVGIETVATLNSVGVGPAIEFFPTENLGVSLGVLASQLQLEEHQELKDFNAATGTEFIDRYQAFLPAQYDQIKAISMRTSVVSLPLNLKYYVPLRRSWSLLFQTGTRFDIGAYQQVRYESYYQADEQFHSFEADARPRFFHNFMFGAGLQYRRPRITAQLNPYYLDDFRNVANTPAGSNVGIKASVWLDLFK